MLKRSICCSFVVLEKIEYLVLDKEKVHSDVNGAIGSSKQGAGISYSPHSTSHLLVVCIVNCCRRHLSADDEFTRKAIAAT